MTRDETPLSELVAAVKAERERAAETLTGKCPACNGTTRYPNKRAAKGTCGMCELEDVPGTVTRPRSWWLSVVGREP